MRKQIDCIPIDPRYAEVSDTIRKLDAQIAQYEDELDVLKKQQKIQSGFLDKISSNPQLEERIESTKKELAETK